MNCLQTFYIQLKLKLLSVIYFVGRWINGCQFNYVYTIKYVQTKPVICPLPFHPPPSHIHNIKLNTASIFAVWLKISIFRCCSSMLSIISIWLHGQFGLIILPTCLGNLINIAVFYYHIINLLMHQLFSQKPNRYMKHFCIERMGGRCRNLNQLLDHASAWIAILNCSLIIVQVFYHF